MECDCYQRRKNWKKSKFQLTHSRGVRPAKRFPGSWCKGFQLTHSRGVRPYDTVDVFAGIISTHALTWSATGIRIPAFVQRIISTHALTWSATATKEQKSTNIKISTHALTWSATGTWCPSGSYSHISTHALTWSATWYHIYDHKPVCYISTHALTWSATKWKPVRSSWKPFQLTHSREVRLHLLLLYYITNVFQLTHSRGVRPDSPFSVRIEFHFNSRTHVECDLALLILHTVFVISTHALTWSATIR